VVVTQNQNKLMGGIQARSKQNMLHFGTLQMDLHLDSHAHSHIATSARELTAVHDRYAGRDAWAKASCVVNQVLVVPMLLCMFRACRPCAAVHARS
jgi:hypothetical protein